MKEPQIRLIVADGDGSGRRVIARLSGDDGLEEWSPDSTRIASIGDNADGRAGTYVVSWIDNDHILVS